MENKIKYIQFQLDEYDEYDRVYYKQVEKQTLDDFDDSEIDLFIKGSILIYHYGKDNTLNYFILLVNRTSYKVKLISDKCFMLFVNNFNGRYQKSYVKQAIYDFINRGYNIDAGFGLNTVLYFDDRQEKNYYLICSNDQQTLYGIKNTNIEFDIFDVYDWFNDDMEYPIHHEYDGWNLIGSNYDCIQEYCDLLDYDEIG